MSFTAGGCTGLRLGGGGGTMSGYAAPALKRVRVGVVGVGSRGTYALKRLAFMPGVDIAAFCDIKEAAMKRCRDFLAQKKLRPAREFFGPEAYRDLCQWDGVDVVYACVPWKLHAPVALAAMRADHHGADAALIGEVAESRPDRGPKVFVRNAFGGRRILDMLVGEQLPRIC